MIVYCDTSFLLSLFREEDANHKEANELASRFDGEEFVLCEAHQIEFPAATRAAVHRTASPLLPHEARGLISRFDRAWNGRDFVRRSLSLEDSASMARALGDAHGWNRRHTAFDLWHLAAAWSFGAGAFLTFDERQKEIGRLLSFWIA